MKVIPARDSSNVVVYVQSISGKKFEPPKKPVVLDQINLTFVPHVLPVVAGTTVAFPNSDEVRHNVFSPSPAKRFNLGTYPRGVVRTVTFDKPGDVALLCNVHEVIEVRFTVAVRDPETGQGRRGAAHPLYRASPLMLPALRIVREPDPVHLSVRPQVVDVPVGSFGHSQMVRDAAAETSGAQGAANVDVESRLKLHLTKTSNLDGGMRCATENESVRPGLRSQHRRLHREASVYSITRARRRWGIDFPTGTGERYRLERL